MKEIVSRVTRKGQVTIPAEVRRRLGVGTPDKVAFVLEDEGVRLKPATVTLASLYGSVPALPNESADLEREIDEAMQAEADRIVGRRVRR
jgi:antitoxin PrlF